MHPADSLPAPLSSSPTPTWAWALHHIHWATSISPIIKIGTGIPPSGAAFTQTLGGFWIWVIDAPCPTFLTTTGLRYRTPRQLPASNSNRLTATSCTPPPSHHLSLRYRVGSTFTAGTPFHKVQQLNPECMPLDNSFGTSMR